GGADAVAHDRAAPLESGPGVAVGRAVGDGAVCALDARARVALDGAVADDAATRRENPPRGVAGRRAGLDPAVDPGVDPAVAVVAGDAVAHAGIRPARDARAPGVRDVDVLDGVTHGGDRSVREVDPDPGDVADRAVADGDPRIGTADGGADAVHGA